MKCRKSHFLSAYIDNMLDEKTKIKFEKHLSECDKCAKELTLLRNLKKEMAHMKRVKAPADFLHKVHVRLDEQSSFKDLLKKLFSPIHIKIPLELAGVLAIVLFFLLIFPSPENPVIENKRELASVSKEPAPPEKQSFKEGVFMAGKVDEPKLADKIPHGAAPAVSGESEADLAMDVIEEEKPLEIALLITSDRDDSYIEESRLLKARSVKKKEMALETKDEAREDKKAGKALSRSNITASEVSEPGILVSFTNMVKNMQGKILAQEYNKKSNQVEFITVEIPSTNYTLFIRNLKKLGKITKQTPPVLQRVKRNIQNRIQFIQSQ
ncbi:MAG: zf-HC2 domain-containing protein [Spirochaetes bacterium]|nr:zf-HC2 domain-containing protein [Spirochaetota bacterium]